MTADKGIADVEEPAAPPAPPSGAAPEPAGSKSPRWVGPAVWRGIWPAIFAVLITLAALWFLGQVRTLVQYLILSWLLSIALEPAVMYLHEKRGWRLGTATGVILAAVLGFFVLMGVLLVPTLVSGVSQISHNIPHYIAQLNNFTRDHFKVTVISSSSAHGSAGSANAAQEFLKKHTGDLLRVAGGLLGGIFATFSVGLFTFYLTANGPQVRRALLARMRPERQQRALWAYTEALKATGGYLYSRGLLALINATLMFITLKIVGVPYALPLALFEGVVAEFIPIVGTYVAATVPALIALAQVSPTACLVVIGEVIVYQQVENYFLSPRLSQKTMELNAGIAFGAAMAGGAVGGFAGAFFALPVAAAVQAFISNYSKRYAVVDSDLTRLDTPRPPKPKKRSRWSRKHHPQAAEPQAPPTGP